MQEKKHFILCVEERNTRKPLKWYQLDAIDWYYARSIIASRFAQDEPLQAKSIDWCVDSLEID